MVPSALRYLYTVMFPHRRNVSIEGVRRELTRPGASTDDPSAGVDRRRRPHRIILWRRVFGWLCLAVTTLAAVHVALRVYAAWVEHTRPYAFVSYPLSTHVEQCIARTKKMADESEPCQGPSDGSGCFYQYIVLGGGATLVNVNITESNDGDTVMVNETSQWCPIPKLRLRSRCIRVEASSLTTTSQKKRLLYCGAHSACIQHHVDWMQGRRRSC